MISVLIPVWNTPPIYLKECIDSCLFQTIQDYEIVIVDNESNSQHTLDLLNQYKSNDKIKVFTCPRQEGKKNLSVALNYGLKYCKYNLVARMDSDDIMIYDRLQKQRDYMLSNKDVDILGGQIYVFPHNYSTNHQKLVTKQLALSSQWFINHPTVMFKKDKILNIGGYREYPELFAEDYDLWIKCLINDYKIVNLPDVLVRYRAHDNNLTKKTMTNPNYNKDMKEIQNKLRESLK